MITFRFLLSLLCLLFVPCEFVSCSSRVIADEQDRRDRLLLVSDAEAIAKTSDHPAMRRLLDEFLAAKEAPYKKAVQIVFAQMIMACDGTGKPEQVAATWPVDTDGKMKVTLSCPIGLFGYGGLHEKAIEISRGNVTGISFRSDQAIDSCPCMTSIAIEYLTSEFTNQIGNIDTLEDLDLGLTNISSEELELLSRLPRLRSVVIGNNDYGSTFTPIVCTHLSRCKELMQIKFTSGDFSMSSMQELATLDKLTSLHLAGRVDSFDSLQALARLPELKRLRVGLRSAIDSPIMLRGLAQIEEIHIEAYSACTELAIEDTPNLRSLFVKIPTRKVKITNAPYLNSLYVGVCNPKGPNGETTPPLPQFHNKPLTLDVRGFAELESLWIGASEYADELPVSLSGVLLGSLPKLKSFGLRNAEELPTIEGTLPAVTELRIEGKAFLSRVIARNGAFPNLRELISGN